MFHGDRTPVQRFMFMTVNTEERWWQGMGASGYEQYGFCFLQPARRTGLDSRNLLTLAE
jgi:hypothetical protein